MRHHLLLPFMAILLLGTVKAAPPAIAAHRGGAALMPENTIPAFENAIRLGVSILEFDMNVTADGQIVIHHDVNVNPAICTPPPGSPVKPGPIRKLTLAEIRQFDCGSTKPANRPQQALSPGAGMPTLDEFFRAVRGSNALFLGETKMPEPSEPDPINPVRFIDLIEPIIRKYHLEDRFILQSFDYRTIDAMRKKNPRIALCLLGARRFKPDYLSLAREHGAMYLMLTLGDTDDIGLHRLQAAGLKIFSGTSNSEAEWADYIRLGFDAVLTDDPQAALAFLKQPTVGR